MARDPKLPRPKSPNGPHPKKGERGQPAHVPTDEMRQTVMIAAALGANVDQIMLVTKVAVSTLYKYYKHELDNGHSIAMVNLGVSAYKRALDGNDAMTRLILMSKGGWTTKHEITGAGGGAVNIVLSKDDDAL